MNTPKDMIVDHIDHDGLNNQKSNLRICTIHENNMNKRPPKNKSHRGVYFRDDDRVRNWLAYITFNKKHIYIGAFNTESEAIEARIKKEIELFGNFSPQNNKRK